MNSLNLSKNEKLFRAYLKKYHPDKYNQLLEYEASKNTNTRRDKIKIKKIKLSENEKNFRRYLKKYHPDKYKQLISMENRDN